jgi:uncharacterized membrane protein YhaH (DUF805 family)
MWALAQSANDGSTGVGLLGSLVYLIVVIFILAATWRVFEKAGKPGWASIVPFYNIIVMLEIAERPVWWLFMFFIPIVNFVFLCMMYHQISRRFGHDTGFTVGLILLSPIFIAILGFGQDKYQPLGMDA